MCRETAALKARRLVVEARVQVLRAGRDVLVCRVRGDSGIYSTSFEGGVWRCGCDHRAKAKTKTTASACSHVLAAQLVWVPGGDR